MRRPLFKVRTLLSSSIWHQSHRLSWVIRCSIVQLWPLFAHCWHFLQSSGISMDTLTSLFFSLHYQVSTKRLNVIYTHGNCHFAQVTWTLSETTNHEVWGNTCRAHRQDYYKVQIWGRLQTNPAALKGTVFIMSSKFIFCKYSLTSVCFYYETCTKSSFPGVT